MYGMKKKGAFVQTGGGANETQVQQHYRRWDGWRREQAAWQDMGNRDEERDAKIKTGSAKKKGSQNWIFCMMNSVKQEQRHVCVTSKKMTKKMQIN